MPDLPSIRVEHEVLHLTARHHIQPGGMIAGVPDIFAANQLTRGRHGSKRTQILKDQTLKQVRPREFRETLIGRRWHTP